MTEAEQFKGMDDMADAADAILAKFDRKLALVPIQKVDHSLSKQNSGNDWFRAPRLARYPVPLVRGLDGVYVPAVSV